LKEGRKDGVEGRKRERKKSNEGRLKSKQGMR
jgi:hypothetical protein